MRRFLYLTTWLFAACSPPQQAPDPAAIARQIREEIPPAPSVEIRGEKFDLVHGDIFSGEDDATLWYSYWGTIHDTLYAIPRRYFDSGCIALAPIMCWKDTVPNLKKRRSYQYGAHAPCGKVRKEFRYSLGFHLVGYLRIEDEQIYIVRHHMHGYPDPQHIVLDDDPRWRGDPFRDPTKTLVISSKVLLMGFSTNGVRFDFFPF